jgi:integrase
MHRPSKNQRAGESKADARYWLQGKRLVLHDSANYSIQIQAKGRRVWFPLGTPNKKGAASKAAEIYTFIQGHGIEAAVERYKPKGLDRTSSPTVGNLIEAALSISSARRHTLDTYAKAFRRIVSDIKGITHERKHDAHGGGSAKWRKKVDAVRLDAITPADVLAWKNAKLRASEADLLAKRRATITLNSTIRNAKALFGRKLLPFIEQTLHLPHPLPLEGVTLEKSPSMRYVSKIDAFAILARAKEEMAEEDPEGFKVLILALVCGLRRSEIDNLLWRAFDFANSALRVEASEFHELKSEDSAGVIDLDADTLALFRGYRAKHPKSVFVIESHNKPRSQTKARCYRCDAVFKRVLAWLRAQGVEGTKPLHTMRKEIGSIIASEHGIFEASRYLRHSDIRITSAFYADKKKVVTPKTFAGLLGPAPSPLHSPSPSVKSSL